MLLAGCRLGTETVSLESALGAGALIPRSGAARLVRLSLDGSRGPGFWEPRPVLPESGWGRPGFGWRPVGERSTLLLSAPPSIPAELHLRFRDRRPRPQPLEVTVLLDGEEAGSITLEGRPASWRGSVEGPGGVAPQRLELRFASPLAVEGRLSLGLTHAGWGAPERRLRKAARTAAPVGEGRLRLEPETVFATWVRLPPGASRLALEARLAGPAEGEAWLTAATVELDAGDVDGGDLGGGARPLARWRLGARGNAWKPLDTDAAPVAGRDVLLLLASAGTSQAVEVRRPSLLGRVAPERKEAAPPPPVEGRPDVLLVVLDAARGDRFDGSYSRSTHPRIDEMLADGTTFRRAFAECPTTSCSMPNLLTGVSFPRSGDTFRARRVAPELVTLAEALQGAGYRTVGLSANPNNSSSRGFDQGFDEFRELWGPNPRHGPFGMSELAVRAIEEQPAGEPLYLQLHYLPPHEPYAPRPEYDVFRDQSYEGPVHPRMSFRPYSDGRRLLEGQDLRQLVDLYDGNLLMADAAVGRVFDALRRSGRWDDTLVVLTADHGEAFMEHDRIGHNTTLHDEMLHVPLLVRLPRGQLPRHDPDRLAAVADVVPTVLGRLGIEAPPGLFGLDLFAPPAEDGSSRLLFARTSHPQLPWLAVRTERWKAIVWPPRQVQMLFDLVEDPGESRNLLLDRPWIFTGLGLLLRDHLEATATGAAGEAVDLSEEEKRALRALGYVE